MECFHEYSPVLWTCALTALTLFDVVYFLRHIWVAIEVSKFVSQLVALPHCYHIITHPVLGLTSKLSNELTLMKMFYIFSFFLANATTNFTIFGTLLSLLCYAR